MFAHYHMILDYFVMSYNSIQILVKLQKYFILLICQFFKHCWLLCTYPSSVIVVLSYLGFICGLHSLDVL